MGVLKSLLKDKELKKYVVPIIPDEARTFGMDPLFNEVGIYASGGQRYDPVDSELVMKYREAKDGQVLEEGISEAGSAASFQAAVVDTLVEKTVHAAKETGTRIIVVAGGALLVVADLLARTVVAPRQLPVGALTPMTERGPDEVTEQRVRAGRARSELRMEP